jgi:hypothetical protein
MGADVEVTAQENASTTGRHAQRNDVVDTPGALKRNESSALGQEVRH